MGLVLLSSLLGLQACSGWTATQLQAQISPELAQIELPAANTRLEQLVLQEWERNILAHTAQKPYKLAFSLSASAASTVAARGASSKLLNTKMVLKFTLSDREGAILLSDSLSASATSGSVSGLYAKEKSEQFSQERLATLLASRLIQNLALYFSAPQDPQDQVAK